MAKHDVDVGFKNPVAGAAFVCAAIAFALADAKFEWFDNPLITGGIAGVVSWAIAQGDVKAGGSLIFISAILFLITISG